MMAKVKRLFRGEGASSFISSLTAIFIGLLVGFVIMLVSSGPAQAANGFISILTGGLSDMRSLGQVLYYSTSIIMTGLSVGFANKTGLFNIGASGQFITGAYVAILIGVKWTFLPGATHWIVCLLGAMVIGGIWGALPGLLKAYRNVNEVISCIMMNYIGMHTVNYLITLTIHDTLRNQSQRVAATANIPKMGFDLLFRDGNNVSSANGGILIAILIGIVAYIVIDKTRFGYELKACGYNRNAARYAGISENRSIVLSMAIAGALAGLGGALLYLAGSGKGIDVVDVLASEGFNGIPVALLGMSHPIGILFSGVFIAYLTQGGFLMQLHGFAPQVIEIITAVIIYFSALSLLFRMFFKQFIKKRSALMPPGTHPGEAAGKPGAEEDMP